jgi:hypothetical protein
MQLPIQKREAEKTRKGQFLNVVEILRKWNGIVSGIVDKKIEVESWPVFLETMPRRRRVLPHVLSRLTIVLKPEMPHLSPVKKRAELITRHRGLLARLKQALVIRPASCVEIRQILNLGHVI